MEEIKQNKEDLIISLKVLQPNNSRESKVNTLILALRELYGIETDYGEWDREIKIKVTNNIIDTMIVELYTLKIEEN